MRYFLDLFAGIGGFALGAHMAGCRFDGHYYSEIDEYASMVYAARFPGALALGDVTKINFKGLPDGQWTIAGGWPCQDISCNGPRIGLAGARSSLWREYARAIGDLRPDHAIMENSPDVTGRGLADVCADLSEMGYDAQWFTISAHDVGPAPHLRERLFILANPCGRHEKIQRHDTGMGELIKQAPWNCTWQEKIKTNFCGVDDGIPRRMDRFRTCGAAIIPDVAKVIFEALQ